MFFCETNTVFQNIVFIEHQQTTDCELIRFLAQMNQIGKVALSY